MAGITLKQAAQWCGGFVEEKYENVEFFGAGNDTRSLEPGKLFVALRGMRDGHDFIPAAMERGAAAALCTRRVGDYPAIYVEDPRIALGAIAREALRRIGCKVVGITGSVGKSTTKEMIAAVLESSYKVCKTPANHNNDIGMPMAILSMDADTQVAVLEMGMNHFREIAYLSDIARPDVGVIINVGTSHIEFLGSREGIRQAKLEITEGMPPEGKLLLNGDNDMLQDLESAPIQAVTYFGCGANCQVRALDVEQTEGHLRFTVAYKAQRFPVELEMEGIHFVPDALAAVAVGLAMDVPPEKIQQSLAAFHNMAGRQEIFQAGEYTVIRDCYNAGPESMEAALHVLGNRAGRKIAVLGDMLELGECAPAEHFKVGRIAAEQADVVLALGRYSSWVRSGAITGGMTDRNARSFIEAEECLSTLKSMAKPGDVLLFKGSHGMHMERILDDFIGKEK